MLGQAVQSHPQVFPEHVLYVRPNPDRSRKMCQNCIMWQPGDMECFIHDADVIATPESVCGYHVFGRPQAPFGGGDFSPRTNMDPVDPKTSGLVQVPGGTSCDRCKFYEPAGALGGTCLFLDDPDEPGAHPTVEALGCCTRWELAE